MVLHTKKPDLKPDSPQRLSGRRRAGGKAAREGGVRARSRAGRIKQDAAELAQASFATGGQIRVARLMVLHTKKAGFEA